MTEGPLTANLLDRSLDDAAAVVRGVRPDQLEGPTPCTDFSVRDLLSHLVGAVGRTAAIGRGDEIEFAPPTTSGVADDGWPEALAMAAADARGVWSDPALAGKTFSLPWGDFSGADIAAMYAMETASHTWDLAVATGQGDRVDGELAEALLPVAGRMLSPEHRGGDVPFGPVVAVADGAPPPVRLAAYLGRDVDRWAGR